MKTKINVRWVARILSLLIVLFWGFMIVGSYISSLHGEHSSGPLSMHDRIGLTLMFLWLSGLALAWRWELAGASLTLVAMAIHAIFINPLVVVALGIFPLFTAILFLVSWWMGRRSRQKV